MFTGLVRRVKEHKQEQKSKEKELSVGELVNEAELLKREDLAFIGALPAYNNSEARQYLHNATGAIILVYALDQHRNGYNAYIGLIQNPHKPPKYNSREIDVKYG